MTRQVDDATWRNRFIIFNITRIAGMVLSLFGVYLMLSDAVRPGGSILLGLPISIVGVAVSFQGPRHLSRKWRQEDGR